MAKGNIDPAMRPAVVLQNSSISPQESYDRSMDRYKLKQQAEIRRRNEIAVGLESLMLDVKAWEDKAGFEEIMKDHQRIINGYLELSKAGLNLTAPKTEREVTAFKAIQDSHNKIMQKVDVYDRNKKQFDVVMELEKQDLARDPSEQKIDHAATRSNLERQLATGGILDREFNMASLLVYKPDIGDVIKYTKEYEDYLPKPTRIIEPYVDPETGQAGTREVERLTKEQQREMEDKLRTRYRTAPDNIKTAVKMQKEKDKTLDVLSDEDYYVSMFSPEYKTTMSNKLSGKSGGLSFDFFGQKVNMEPGQLSDVPLPYGDRTYTSAYRFQNTKPIKINLGDKGSKMFAQSQWLNLGGGGNIEAELLFYDSNTDELVFRTTQASNVPFIPNNSTVSIPRAVVGNQADELRLMDDGKAVKLKDKFGEMKPVIKTIGGRDFRQEGILIPNEENNGKSKQ